MTSSRLDLRIVIRYVMTALTWFTCRLLRLLVTLLDRERALRIIRAVRRTLRSLLTDLRNVVERVCYTTVIDERSRRASNR